MNIPRRIVGNILGKPRRDCRSRNVKTTGDFDVDTGQYDINYGECQVCGNPFRIQTKNPLCSRCERQAKEEFKEQMR